MAKKTKLYTFTYQEHGGEPEVLVYSTAKARNKDYKKFIKEITAEAEEYSGEWEDNWIVSTLDVTLDEGYN